MPKWYRISLSLAAKCRLGFSVAVLLIIGSALFVPYRWMDKLVEQGKLEQAQAEVQHVLRRHFQPVQGSEALVQLPPLLLSEDEKDQIKTGKWSTRDGKYSEEQTEYSYVVSSDEESNEGGPSFSEEKIHVRWLALKEERDDSLRDVNSPSIPEVLDHQDQPKAESEHRQRPLLPGDRFERSSLQAFIQDQKRKEQFRFYEDRGRYLRAVRADHSCLLGGCHSRLSEDTGNNSISQGPCRIFNEGQLVGAISVIIPEGQTSATLLFNRLSIVAAGFLSGVCAIVTFYLITQRFILHPVRRLREAADQLMIPAEDTKEGSEAEQDSWHRVMEMMQGIKTRDEFERLAKAYYLMLERLKLSQDRLRESNRALDIQLGELESKNLALYESNKFKSEFLANVSHELRTPLNAIIGFAQILQEQTCNTDDEKMQRYANNVLKSSRLLLGIINDLLDLAKIEAGKVELRWEQCSIGEIAEALLNLTRPLIEEKELVVEIQIDEHLGLVETDPSKVQQILFNLLSNAIKFTPSKGRIELCARRVDEDHFELSISDSGPGIPEDARETIFEKFRQLDGSVTKEHSGTGLGLAIVKELVEILRGTIAVGGEVGKGTIITVVLPIHRIAEEKQNV